MTSDQLVWLPFKSGVGGPRNRAKACPEHTLGLGLALTCSRENLFDMRTVRLGLGPRDRDGGGDRQDWLGFGKLGANSGPHSSTRPHSSRNTRTTQVGRLPPLGKHLHTSWEARPGPCVSRTFPVVSFWIKGSASRCSCGPRAVLPFPFCVRKHTSLLKTFSGRNPGQT